MIIALKFGILLLVLMTWFCDVLRAYIVTPHRYKRGYTWYIFRGQNLSLPCDADNLAGIQPSTMTWVHPNGNRAVKNSTTGALEMIDLQLPDSAEYKCNVGHNTNYHVVLIVAEPVDSYARSSVRFYKALTCKKDISTDIVNAIHNEACKVPEVNVDGRCIVLTLGACAKLPKNIDKYLFEFIVENLIPSSNLADFTKKAEEECSVCKQGNICVTSFDCLQTKKLHALNQIQLKIRVRIGQVLQKWFSEGATVLREGYDPMTNPPMPLDSVARCPYAGYQWFNNTLCIPCPPGTYRKENDPKDVTPATCSACSSPDTAPHYGAENCYDRPTVPPEAKSIDHPKIADRGKTPEGPLSLPALIGIGCAVFLVFGVAIILAVRRFKMIKNKEKMEIERAAKEKEKEKIMQRKLRNMNKKPDELIPLVPKTSQAGLSDNRSNSPSVHSSISK